MILSNHRSCICRHCSFPLNCNGLCHCMAATTFGISGIHAEFCCKCLTHFFRKSDLYLPSPSSIIRLNVNFTLIMSFSRGSLFLSLQHFVKKVNLNVPTMNVCHVNSGVMGRQTVVTAQMNGTVVSFCCNGASKWCLSDGSNHWWFNTEYSGGEVLPLLAMRILGWGWESMQGSGQRERKSSVWSVTVQR